MRYLATILLCAAFFTNMQAQTTNQVVFSFTHTIGDDTLGLGKAVFTNWNGRIARITSARFYLSTIDILQPDGGTTSLTDRYVLVDASDEEPEYDLGMWPVDAAQGVRMGLGVDSAHNHLDPTTYPADHPLALQNPSMHWGWAAGYTFMAIEGEVDNNNDGIPETVFQFHNINDILYKTIELSGAANAENGTLHLHFDLDYTKLFTGIPLILDYFNHGSNPLNQQMMTNAVDEGFFTMTSVSAAPEVSKNSISVSAAPNPADAETLIRTDIPGAVSLDLVLTNNLGQPVRILHGLPASGATRLTTAGLPAGMYRYALYDKGVLRASEQLVVKH